MLGFLRSTMSATAGLPVKNPRRLIGIVGVFALTMVGAAAGVVLNLANHEARIKAMETVRQHPRAVALPGRPVEGVWFTQGTITFGENRTGRNSISPSRAPGATAGSA